MTGKLTLSEKIIEVDEVEVIGVWHVKEFIKLLKLDISKIPFQGFAHYGVQSEYYEEVIKLIDNLAGDKLK